MKTLTFGSYKQGENGEVKPIEWEVLEENNGEILMISKYVLEAKKFHKDWVDITWDKCTLRQWLNNEFLNEAFTKEEAEEIVTSKVVPHENTLRNLDNGEATSDKVYLLSLKEAEEYYSSKDERKAIPTKFLDKSNELGEFRFDEYKKEGVKTCWWWLRTTGYYQSHAIVVDLAGDSYRFGEYASDKRGGVRPVIKIKKQER